MAASSGNKISNITCNMDWQYATLCRINHAPDTDVGTNHNALTFRTLQKASPLVARRTVSEESSWNCQSQRKVGSNKDGGHDVGSDYNNHIDVLEVLHCKAGPQARTC